MMDTFERQVKDWQRRKSRMGDGAVGRQGEQHADQQSRIAAHLAPHLDGFYEHGLDFGCGWGRFSKLLSQHCGHLWSVDLFEDWTARAAEASPTITPITLREPKFPLARASVNLAIDIMTMQSIKDDKLMLTFANEIKRVTVKGAKIISLHFVKPELTTRSAAHRAKQLGMVDWKEFRLDDVDEADETYSLLVGVRM